MMMVFVVFFLLSGNVADRIFLSLLSTPPQSKRKKDKTIYRGRVVKAATVLSAPLPHSPALSPSLSINSYYMM